MLDHALTYPDTLMAAQVLRRAWCRNARMVPEGFRGVEQGREVTLKPISRRI